MKPNSRLILYNLIQAKERLKVAPKLECFRKPCRIKVAYGGRGAGAKTHSFASLICQRAHREKIRVACLREFQGSLEESVYETIQNKVVSHLQYHGWRFTKEFINSPVGSHFIFRGLKDLRAAGQIKGLEDFDIFWIDEASAVSADSFIVLMPTLRKPGSELWISFNRENEFDPVYNRFVVNPRTDSKIVWLEPGRIDNPWWTDELQKELEEDYKRNPDEAEHVWGGQPRKQGFNAILSRVLVKQAMQRKIEAEGAIEVGCDPADMGDDKTEIYIRKGWKIIDHKELRKQDGGYIAKEINAMIKGNPSIPIKFDVTGIGVDLRRGLKELGLKGIPINFAEVAKKPNQYPNIASELWFDFQEILENVSIPDDAELMQDLSGRLYDYDTKGRRCVEPKKEFKKRFGRSCDCGDALLLTYFTSHGMLISDKAKAEMRERNQRK